MDKLFDFIPYDKLTEAKPSHYIAGGVAAGLLFFAIYFFTLHSAMEDEFAALEKSRSQKVQTLKRNRVLVGQRDWVAKELARSIVSLDSMKQQMPKGKDMPALLKKVADFGKGRESFEMLSFQLEEGKVNDFYKEIPITIQSRGSFWDMLDFMDAIQNLLRLVSLSDLKMEVRTEKNTKGEKSGIPGTSWVHTKFTAKTYAYIEGAEKKPPGKGKKS